MPDRLKSPLAVVILTLAAFVLACVVGTRHVGGTPLIPALQEILHRPPGTTSNHMNAVQPQRDKGPRT